MPAPGDHLDLFFQWEVRTWSRAYPLWHRTLQAIPVGHRLALALGERDGGLSLMLAEHGFTTVCSDLNGPTARAVELHQTLGWNERITYEAIDATAIPKPDNSFDVVVFKSMVGALGSKERQAQAICEMHRLLKPGGVLLFAENLTGTAMHRWLRRRFVAWDHYWRYLRLPVDRDLFAPFSRLDLHSTGCLANLGRSERQRDVLARLDGMIGPLVPSRWHTVVYGVAVK
jgi:SAM-dependent methyltransferase